MGRARLFSRLRHPLLGCVPVSVRAKRKREYTDKWRAANRAKHLAARRKWRAANRVKINAANRARWARIKDEANAARRIPPEQQLPHSGGRMAGTYGQKKAAQVSGLPRDLF